MMLFWDAPLDDCDGFLLTDLDHYELPVFRTAIIGMVPCGEELESLCPIYNRRLTRMVAYTESLTLAEPALGEVLGWLEPISVDTAGNTSEMCE